MGGRKKENSDPNPEEPLSPEWFEAILCSLNDGVFCIDGNWRITCFNQAAADITSFSKEEAIGRHCWEVFRSNICRQACALKYTMETGNPLVNLMVAITDSKNEKKPISVSTALLKDKKGRIAGGVETFRDISLVEKLRSLLDAPAGFYDIIGKSSGMRRLFEMIPVVAKSDSTILITGESGTGKDLVARAIHKASPRKEGPFVSVNCGAIPETLLESELFGYKAGAFTDARRDKAGRFALASGGTLFLDEIGDIPPALQVKLLRVLQEKVYEPLGGVESIRADARIVAATNRDLKELIREGLFRTDLYYRINVISLHLPPLRERKEDIPPLADRFIARFATIKGKDIPGLSPDALAILMNHDYPGNVRELENIIEHAFVLCPGGLIMKKHLPEYLREAIGPEPESGLGPMERYEKELILASLKKNGWNRTRAAAELNIHKTTLFRKIRKLGIAIPPKNGRSGKSTS